MQWNSNQIHEAKTCFIFWPQRHWIWTDFSAPAETLIPLHSHLSLIPKKTLSGGEIPTLWLLSNKRKWPLLFFSPNPQINPLCFFLWLQLLYAFQCCFRPRQKKKVFFFFFFERRNAERQNNSPIDSHFLVINLGLFPSSKIFVFVT